jgi:hypothetical protein
MVGGCTCLVLNVVAALRMLCTCSLVVVLVSNGQIYME